MVPQSRLNSKADEFIGYNLPKLPFTELTGNAGDGLMETVGSDCSGINPLWVFQPALWPGKSLCFFRPQFLPICKTEVITAFTSKAMSIEVSRSSGTL